MSVEPALRLRLDRPTGIIDPRSVMVRNTVGYRSSSLGKLILTPANTVRPWFNPLTGRSEGIEIEHQRTNLLLESNLNTVISWTVNNITRTVNDRAAPTGLVVATKLAVTGASGSIDQTFSITAGRGIAYSVFVRPIKSSFIRLRLLTSSGDEVEAAFNLNTGTTSYIASGGGTITADQAYCRFYTDGWVRCTLCVTTGGVTSINARMMPTSGATSVSAKYDSVHIWNFQAEADHNKLTASSPIDTVMSTVTRDADNLYIPANLSWYSTFSGSMLFEVLPRHLPSYSGTPQSFMIGGLGDTFTNTVYILRIGNTTISCNFLSATGNISLSRTVAFTTDTPFRVAVAWAQNDVAMCLGGGTVATSGSTFLLAGSTPRFGLGMPPYGTSASTTLLGGALREFAYYPRRLSNTLLQSLTLN